MSYLAQSLKIQHFLQHSRYRYIGDQSLDLSTTLTKDCWAVLEDRGTITGFLSLHQEARPSTLSASVPERIYIRTLGIANRYSPTVQLALLLNSALAKLEKKYDEQQSSFQLICYGSEPWLVRALLSAGFEIVERIQYFQLERLGTMGQSEKLSTRAIVQEDSIGSFRQEQAPDFAALAQLDAETFEPLWHFGESELRRFWSHSWTQTAYVNDILIGYAIMTGASLSDTDIKEKDALYSQPINTIAQLVRLAIHPSAQGQGIGRQLLSVSLIDAYSRGIRTVTLNTQTTNEPSKKLYRSFGFRPHGGTIPILVKRG